jgi:CheY-like chemotaxis protein
MQPPHRSTVLVVEDDGAVRSLLCILLREDLDARTVPVSTGSEALAALATFQLDLVVLDMMLPEVHGLDVLRALRAGPETSDVPVIGLSAAFDRAKALDAGCNGFLNKPFDFEDLTGLARSLLPTA